MTTTTDTAPLDVLEVTLTFTDDAPTAPTPAQIKAALLPNLPKQEATESREAWLAAALALIHGTASPLPVSYGFGRGGTRSLKGYSIHNDTHAQPQLFIHPTTKEPAQLIARLCAATLPARCKDAQIIAQALPAFPTEGLDSTEAANKDGIRQVKCICPACGFTFRTSRRWIEKGLPVCACGTQTKEAAQ
jgi:hypothetical protein